jgi:hypothetical protein
MDEKLSDEPFHLLLFYAFLSGFAGVLLDDNIPHDSAGHGPIEKYRRESLASGSASELSAPGQSELTISSALESYLGERTWLLSDPSSRNWSVAVIRDPVSRRTCAASRERLPRFRRLHGSGQLPSDHARRSWTGIIPRARRR